VAGAVVTAERFGALRLPPTRLRATGAQVLEMDAYAVV
jgi:hypothetical protein